MRSIIPWSSFRAEAIRASLSVWKVGRSGLSRTTLRNASSAIAALSPRMQLILIWLSSPGAAPGDDNHIRISCIRGDSAAIALLALRKVVRDNPERPTFHTEREARMASALKLDQGMIDRINQMAGEHPDWSNRK